MTFRDIFSIPKRRIIPMTLLCVITQGSKRYPETSYNSYNITLRHNPKDLQHQRLPWPCTFYTRQWRTSASISYRKARPCNYCYTRKQVRKREAHYSKILSRKQRRANGVNWQQASGTIFPLASLTIEVDSIMLCPSHAFIDAVMSSILLETKDRPLV